MRALGEGRQRLGRRTGTGGSDGEAARGGAAAMGRALEEGGGDGDGARGGRRLGEGSGSERRVSVWHMDL